MISGAGASGSFGSGSGSGWGSGSGSGFGSGAGTSTSGTSATGSLTQLTSCGEPIGMTAPITAAMVLPHAWIGATTMLLSVPLLMPALLAPSATATGAWMCMPVLVASTAAREAVTRMYALPFPASREDPCASAQENEGAQRQSGEELQRLVRDPDASVTARLAEHGRI